MATLEDKILGEKTQYYCDSSEGEENSDDETPPREQIASSSVSHSLNEPREWDGSSVNTGPKGVLKDWQRYKQLENEKRESQDAERKLLIQKLSLTCRSHLDDEHEKELMKKDEDDQELAELLEDSFLKEYVQRRMEEMLTSRNHLPKFGLVLHLENGEQFLKAVDKEHKEVTVIIHLYEDHNVGCEAMHGCLSCLAQEYPQVKFCRLKASVAGLTKQFKINGVPALLVYKAGNLVGNFVRLTDEFGDDFFAVDVESFLIENGILPDKTLVPEIIRNATSSLKDEGSCNSDFELD